MADNSNINTPPDVATFLLPEDRLIMSTRAWLIWLQGLFKNRPAGRHRWSPDVNETEVIISDHSPAGMEVTNKRPMITTSRGGASFSSTSINQVMTPSLDGSKTVYSDLIGTSMTISVVAREGLEAQDLAYMIFRMIPVFKTQIMRLGRMHAIGNNIQVTQESQHGQIVPGSSTPEWKMVQLIIPFYIQDTISSEEKDFYTVLRAVTLHMGLDC